MIGVRAENRESHRKSRIVVLSFTTLLCIAALACEGAPAILPHGGEGKIQRRLDFDLTWRVGPGIAVKSPASVRWEES
jgi:hypothetical protein